MEDLRVLIDVWVSIMKVPFEIWGFTLSMWDIMLSVLIGGVVIWFIVRLLYD